MLSIGQVSTGGRGLPIPTQRQTVAQKGAEHEHDPRERSEQVKVRDEKRKTAVSNKRCETPLNE
jgi:hypothetical protein